ncbi:MAG: LacI family DNA-binding transcriptional regulator [Spirochaetota bacterium]
MSTYKEIADRSGVSIGTVYRVLHERGRYSRRTAERVRSVAEELGYTRNIYASNLSRSRTYRIALVIPEPSHDNSYWAQPHEGVVAAIHALRHYRIDHMDVFYDEHDPDSLLRRLSELADMEADAAIIAPTVAADRADLLAAAGISIPHVLIDTEVPSPARLGFVGQDSYASGRSAGHLLRLLAPGARRLLAIRSVPASQHIEQRIAGMRDYLAEHGSLVPDRIDVDFADPEAARARIGAALVADGRPDACFVSNSNASLCADIFDEIGREPIPPIVGYDLVPANVQALRSGRLSVLLSQRPTEQGRLAVDIVYRSVILGGPPVGDVRVPIDIVTPENLDGYL